MSINDDTLRQARALRVRVDREVNATTRQLVQAWARAWDEIRDAWLQAATELAAASVNGAWPPPMVVARSEQARRALETATAKIAELAQYTGVTVTDGTGRVVDLTPDGQARIIASQLPPQAGTRAELTAVFNRVDPYALDAIVRRTTGQITASTYHLGVVAQEQMRRVLIRGVAVGDSPRTAAREMLRRSEGAFNGGLTRAMTIARTEMLDAHRAAAQAAQIANQQVLAGWVWQAQLDTATCPSCWAEHGQQHPLTEPGPLDHHNGRCGRMPVTKTWAELGFDITEPESLLPDAQVVFDSLPRSEQLKIMGAGRMAAMDRGASLRDMSQRRTTPGWRDSYHPTRVRDLAGV